MERQRKRSPKSIVDELEELVPAMERARKKEILYRERKEKAERAIGKLIAEYLELSKIGDRMFFDERFKQLTDRYGKIETSI